LPQESHVQVLLFFLHLLKLGADMLKAAAQHAVTALSAIAIDIMYHAIPATVAAIVVAIPTIHALAATPALPAILAATLVAPVAIAIMAATAAAVLTMAVTTTNIYRGLEQSRSRPFQIQISSLPPKGS
jgi:hypothetical protein